ncbi:RNA polymerase sigma factor, partial [Nocardioides hungaricus]
MTAFLAPESASDLDLISAAGDGDSEAVAVLYARHHDAAVRYARGLTDPTTAEDLVAEAFAKLLESIRAGGGPQLAFRAYLLRTVHNVYVNHVRRDSRHAWVEDADQLDVAVPDETERWQESSLLAASFASLPERWQAVLWHTTVEGDDHETVGRLLGLKPNAVAALAFRAREGLRGAYLAAHLSETCDEACRPYREDLPLYARSRLRGRRRQRLEAHLAACPDCTAAYLELHALSTDLGAVLAPVLLGAAAATYAGTGTGTAAAGGVVGLFADKPWLVSLGAGVSAAAVVATAVGAVAWVGRGDGPGGATVAPSPQLSEPTSRAAAPTASATASPTRPRPAPTTVVVVPPSRTPIPTPPTAPSPTATPSPTPTPPATPTPTPT